MAGVARERGCAFVEACAHGTADGIDGARERKKPGPEHVRCGRTDTVDGRTSVAALLASNETTGIVAHTQKRGWCQWMNC